MNRKGRKLMKYWTDGKKTVWILEEVGKARPITTGYVVENKQIKKVRVLIFRETHGYEVRHPIYTSQFEGATLESMTKLDRDIDGISGATLSHWALEKMAKLALYLDSVVMN
ncbi:MAG: FMN-binding protein [Burkholderiaceae bacterium]